MTGFVTVPEFSVRFINIITTQYTTQYYSANVIIWDEMLSSGANVIIWVEMLSSGANVII